MIQLEKKIFKAMGIFVMIFAIAVGILAVTPHHVEAKSKSWKKIYRTFLKKHSLNFYRIGTAQLDKNKIPELITSDGAVFTIKKGKVKRLKSSGYVSINGYWHKGNCFCYSDGDAEGGLYICYYTIKNGKIIKIKEFDYSGDKALAHGEYWRINGKDVTKAQYQQTLASFKKTYTKKYGKARVVKFRDYTRYHRYDKKTRRYEAETQYVKAAIRGNKLIVKGSMKGIYGKKHVFKLTSKTRFIYGDMRISKNKFKRNLKIKGLWLILDTKKGKVVNAIIVG